MRQRTCGLLSTLPLICLLGQPGIAADWPAFRGPRGDGFAAAGTRPPLKWDAATNVAWRVPLPEPGNSSPIVVGTRVFVATADRTGKQLSLLARRRSDGAPLWEQTVVDDDPQPTHSTNPYAASTPASNGDLVVVWYGDAGLHAYSLDGEPLWSAATPAVKHIWGYGSSPVIAGSRVFLNVGMGAEAYMAAFDVMTGKPLWKTPEPGGEEGGGKKGGWVGSWSTPVLVTVAGREQLLCSQSTRVNAYDPATGAILWSCDGLDNQPKGSLAYTSLSIDNGRGLALGGFNGPAMAFELGGTGNITQDRRLWRDGGNHPQRIGSAVVIGGSAFVANAGPGLLQCLDVSTGKERWKARVGDGAPFWASVVQADGRLYATSQSGTTFVFAPNADKLELLAENVIPEHCNATLALADGEAFLRTDKALYCFRESP